MSNNKPPPYQPNDSSFRRDTAGSPGNTPQVIRSNRESWIDTPEVDIPEVRVLYYRIYSDDDAINCKTAFDPSDPTLGRLIASKIPPPHTVLAITRHIAKREGTFDANNAIMYGRVSDATALDLSSRIEVMQGDGVGSSAEQPLAILLSSSTPLHGAPTTPSNVIASRPTSPPLSEKAQSDKDVAAPKIESSNSVTSTPNAGATIKPTQTYNRITVQVDLESHNNKHKSYTVFLKPGTVIQEQNKPVFDRIRDEVLEQIDGAHQYDDLTCTFEPSNSREITIVNSSSCHSQTPSANGGGLSISKGETFLDFFKGFRSSNPCVSFYPFQSKIEYDIPTIISGAGSMSMSESHIGSTRFGSRVRIGPACIAFRRTLRVPDDGKEHVAPADLGAFPIVNTAECSSARFPGFFKGRGGCFIPVRQREAILMNFRGSGGSAIKISVGGINAISGLPQAASPPHATEQDYVVGNVQPWLETISTSPGSNRQLIAMSLDQRGIQIDVTPSYEESVLFEGVTDLLSTPLSCGLPVGSKIKMVLKRAIYANTLAVYKDQVGSAPTIYLKTSKPTNSGFGLKSFFTNDSSTRLVSPPKQKVPLPSQLSQSHSNTVSTIPADTSQSVTVIGGRIKQKVYPDNHPVKYYDTENSLRVWIHTVSPAEYERILGIVTPPSPIDPTTYRTQKYPWIPQYDEPQQHFKESGRFDFTSTKSDNPTDSMDFRRSPPKCSTHTSKPGLCVVRSCDHFSCKECLESTFARSNACPFCHKLFDALVGFDKSIVKVIPDVSDIKPWWAVEDKDKLDVEGVSSKIVTLVLPDDQVSALHGKA